MTGPSGARPDLGSVGLSGRAVSATRFRWKRRRLLWRSLRSRHDLTPINDRTATIARDQVLCFATMRNEGQRLPHFLTHYRALGVSHFLIVDNASTDGTAGLLAAQPDVSLWSTDASYKGARFGLDWLTWLQMRYGHARWCLTVDADELLIYPHWKSRDLRALTGWLQARGVEAFGALMIELYPQGPLGSGPWPPEADPLSMLPWFDANGYRAVRQMPAWNLWVQGGVRDRVFFADTPRQAPTLNKLPLVRWNRRYAYMNSTHSVLPRRLNLAYDGPGDKRCCGALLHTKFLPTVVEKSAEEKHRRQHFGAPERFDAYYDRIIERPDLWNEHSRLFRGWEQLVSLGLMSAGEWH